jgi:hypothetical protein
LALGVSLISIGLAQRLCLGSNFYGGSIEDEGDNVGVSIFIDMMI